MISEKAEIDSCSFSGKVRIGDFCRLFNVSLSGNILIGKNTSIFGPNTDIYSVHNKVEIGNFCSIARNVSIQEFNHNYERCSTYFIFKNVFKEKNIISDTVSKGDIKIGHDVWIGTQSVILSGSIIGNGAVIAANSVITGDIPPYSIVGGTPARVLKYRFSDDIIQALQKIEWWNWDHEKIKRNRDFFESPMNMKKIINVVS
ncbi:MAG: CatB-related O-acetyltransferase [Bacteroidetes bacterium]|nr:CatB-related O-acetyltransferase [Bacteroidota bacterium]